MIGYMKPDRSNMAKEDWKLFRMYYCTTCHTLRNVYSLTSPLFLSYESVCFHLLSDSAAGIAHHGVSGMCSFSPMIPVNYTDYRSEDFINTADASLRVSLAELTDDSLDGENAWKKLLLKLACKAIKTGELQIGEQMNRFSESESAGSTIDLLNSCGQLAADLMRPVYQNTDAMHERLMREVISAAARWEYLLDAYDDYAKDEKKNRFNLLYTMNDRKDGIKMMKSERDTLHKAIVDMDLKINHELIDYLFVINPERIEYSVLSKRGFIDEN